MMRMTALVVVALFNISTAEGALDHRAPRATGEPAAQAKDRKPKGCRNDAVTVKWWVRDRNGNIKISGRQTLSRSCNHLENF